MTLLEKKHCESADSMSRRMLINTISILLIYIND